MLNNYRKNLKYVFQRPTLNGINGEFEKRSAHPLELFFDLVFVIALANIALQLEHVSYTSIITALLLYVTVYSVWYSITEYSVMFTSSKTNYFSRLMIFLVMIPMVFMIGITELTNDFEVRLLVISLISSRLLMGFIWRDAVVNAPLNNISLSKVYIVVAKYLILSGCIFIIPLIFPNLLIPILLINLFIESIIMPLHRKKITKTLYFKVPMDEELLVERYLLFVIIVFGEGIVQAIGTTDLSYGIEGMLSPLLLFSIAFFFYIRVYEEFMFTDCLEEKEKNYNHFILNFLLLFLFTILGSLPDVIHEYNYLPMQYKVLLFCLLQYIVISHIRLNIKVLMNNNKVAKDFYILDLITLIIMGIISVGVFLINQINGLYLLVLIFFILHVVAVPLRAHIIDQVQFD